MPISDASEMGSDDQPVPAPSHALSGPESLSQDTRQALHVLSCTASGRSLWKMPWDVGLLAYDPTPKPLKPLATVLPTFASPTPSSEPVDTPPVLQKLKRPCFDKLYSSAFPLSVFLKRLSMLACMTGIELDVFHVPGEKNDDADLLSRWSDESQPLPAKFLPDFRVDCSLARIWHFRSDVRLWPPDAKLKWQPP